jgi:hypothetical protein
MIHVFNKKYIILILIFFCVLGVLTAQTAAEIETLLRTPSVTYAQAARFILKASEAADISSPRAAFDFAAEKNWLPKDASPDSQARLDEISLLFMESFKLKGGVLYSLFKKPHYAYRELMARGAIKGKTDPAMTVSGEQLLYMTSRILSLIEEK